MSSEAVDYDAQVAAVREAFEREFERFARFRTYEGTEGLALDEAEALLREVKELTHAPHREEERALAADEADRARAAEERASFGQVVQQLDKEIRGALGDVAGRTRRSPPRAQDRARAPGRDAARPPAAPRPPPPDHASAPADRGHLRLDGLHRSRTGRRSRPTSTTSPRSTSPSCTRRARRRTPSTRPTV